MNLCLLSLLLFGIALNTYADEEFISANKNNEWRKLALAVGENDVRALFLRSSGRVSVEQEIGRFVSFWFHIMERHKQNWTYLVMAHTGCHSCFWFDASRGEGRRRCFLGAEVPAGDAPVAFCSGQTSQDVWGIALGESKLYEKKNLKPQRWVTPITGFFHHEAKNTNTGPQFNASVK
ncbi:hypothetical protein AV530_015573 [Patagioenas fasciata monilis]|uniref:Uncharacterized protein n=1 Tax=Patagioenas fasciata monilis TaxID=372326 RepID=A0A1V4KI05_PATFA|nr:hypothetical protein AV530_015573 [Patagioenas fasciata monilis]